MEIQLKRITFLVDEGMMNKIEILKKHNTHLNITEVVRSALNAYYKDSFKYGQNPAMNSIDNDSEEAILKKAELKAKSKKALAEAQESIKIAPKIKICKNVLGGEVRKDDSGFLYCDWTMFSITGAGDTDQSVPLKAVSESYADTSLFSPSKKAVLNKRPELKEKFK